MELAARLDKMALRLGYSDAQLKAERQRCGSERVLLHRLRTRWSTLCRAAERDDAERWSDEESARRRMIHEQERALILARVRQHRESLPLHARLGRVLAEMELAQGEGKSSTYEAQVSGAGSNGDLRLVETPMLDEWRPRFERVIRLAEREADQALGRVVHVRDRGEERDKRILRDYEGEPPDLAAIQEGCSEPHIRAVRSRYGRRSKDGYKHAA